MEHQPLMYERDFGPWPPDQLIENCLHQVDKSDLFLLFISDKAGNYNNYYKATVTHREFQQAFKRNKYIIVFAEEYIYNIFWNELRPLINNELERYKRNHGKNPDTYYDIAAKAWDNFSDKNRYSNIDTYIWGFMYDIYQKGYYLEKLPLGSDPILPIKKYFSDLFREGSRYLALRSTIDEQLNVGPMYKKLSELSSNLITYIENGEIQNSRMFLELLQRYLQGGTITHRPGTLFEEVIGSYESCAGSTLYKEMNNQLQLINSSGMASKDNEYFDLTDYTSYVVKAFHSETGIELFFNEEKQQFYLSIKSGNYVICFHYPAETHISENTVQHFHEDIIRDIMEAESALYRDFAIQLLGGIK